MSTSMQKPLISVAIALLMPILFNLVASGDAHQPYAGLHDRAIKALTQERIDGLLAGDGLGFALAAELNHYPGPTHVLALADELDVSKEQQAEIHRLYTDMKTEAKQLGETLVNLERDLDRAFVNQEMTPERLERLTGAIAAVEGELRYVHLRAHLSVKSILTHEQVARYDHLRGYAEDDGSTQQPEHPHQMHGNH